jgi:hypothetical protein
MYFNRERQCWEGGDEVDMSGFDDDDSDGDEANVNPGGSSRSPCFAMVRLAPHLKVNHISCPPVKPGLDVRESARLSEGRSRKPAVRSHQNPSVPH